MAFETDDPPLAERRIPAGDDFLAPADLAALTPEIIVERMKALAPRIAAVAVEAERLRRPVDEIWAAIRASGYFYMYVPKAFGGLEVTTDQFIDASLPIAEACASTGWVASFCAEHNWILAHFPVETQAALFGGDFPYIIAPVVSAPPGMATPVEGGYRVTARWKWGTGIMHADWVGGSAIVVKPEGPPQVLTVLLPAADVEVLDTWHVAGMVGTGSNDIVVRDVFVPAARTVPMDLVSKGQGPGSRGYDNPIYSMPMLPFLSVTAAISAVGAARSALGAFRARLEQHVRMGAQARQADRPAAQIRLGKAAVMVDVAEQTIRQAGRDNVAAGALKGAEQVAARIAIRGRVAYAVQLCREAVALLGEAAGSGAQMLDQPFQRAVRDINTISTHVVFDIDTVLELHGRSLVGLPPNSMLV
ncbi:MAG: acyl-CoA dehydrogenase [Phenylobacterium zucineum]|nr:MAG: acyl-CoA dehydrogenase [Phenylobacterium zucineum]